MKSSELKARGDIDGALDESVLLLDIVENREVLGSERHLRLSDLALGVVLKRELELGEVVEKLARHFVQEEETVAVEFGGHAELRSVQRLVEEGEEGGGAMSRWRRRWFRGC